MPLFFNAPKSLPHWSPLSSQATQRRLSLSNSIDGRTSNDSVAATGSALPNEFPSLLRIAR